MDDASYTARNSQKAQHQPSMAMDGPAPTSSRSAARSSATSPLQQNQDQHAETRHRLDNQAQRQQVQHQQQEDFLLERAAAAAALADATSSSDDLSMITQVLSELHREQPDYPFPVEARLARSTSLLSVPGAFPDSSGVRAPSAPSDRKIAGHLLYKLATLCWNHKVKVVCVSIFLIIGLTQCDCREDGGLKQPSKVGGALGKAQENSFPPPFYEPVFLAATTSASFPVRVFKSTIARARSTASVPLPVSEKQCRLSKGSKAGSS